ncbi:MAG: hypothetical protein K2K80_03080 [Clostridia bacterium]|nr:hypothetical protein [Clostridia bacterium]
MKKDKAHFIAFAGVMFALIIVLFLLESFVLTGLGVTACILSLPVSIALSIYDDWKKSFLGGTLLGLASCLFCLIMASFIIYANPLISVLPRTFIGITSYWTYRGISKLTGKAKNAFVRDIIPASVAGVVGSVTNTVLYLLAVNIWMGSIESSLTDILTVAVSIYFPIELAACLILVPIYTKVLKKINHTLITKPEKVTADGENVVNDNMS